MAKTLNTHENGNNANTVLPPVYLSEYALLEYQYKGCLGKHNESDFPAETYLFQCLFGIVHFHTPLN